MSRGMLKVRRVQGDADAGDATMTAPTTLALTTTLTMVASSSASRCSSSTAAQAVKLTVLHALTAHGTAAAIRKSARSALPPAQKI